MVEFFQQYTLEATLIFLFVFGTAIKEGWDLVKYFKDKTVDHVDEVRQRELALQQALDGIAKQQEELLKINEKLDELIQSDKDSIKSWIVMLYRKYKASPIDFDSMEMDLLERRYGHYKQEGGNSYIDNIMVELREIYNDKEDKDASV